MIEAYAFLAAFVVQIFVGSILNPNKLNRYIRNWAVNFGSDRLAQLYPDFNYGQWAERFTTRYLAINIAVALLGLVVLGWMFSLVGQPEWVKNVTRLVIAYFFLQMSPLVLFALYTVVRYHKMFLQMMRPSNEPRRTAVLQRRGLFDFVSPVAVLVAVLSYLLFVGVAIYLDLYVYNNTTLSRQCLIAIGSVTFCYALNGFIIYRYLYGRKNPFVTHEGRVHMISMTVKSGVYSSIAVAWFIALMGTLGQPELHDWKPFALTAFLGITAFLSFIEVGKPRQNQDVAAPAPSNGVAS